MTLIDMITLGLVRTDAQAEKFAEQIVDRWHQDLVPGELRDVLGLTHREYQAWTTGGVSLLTIARWHQSAHPSLDFGKAWFKLSGKAGNEKVGYLEDRVVSARSVRAAKSSKANKKRPTA